MNIALYGIQGTYNFGCEAIIRGAVVFINDIFPDSSITYFSYSYEYDQKALSDLKIKIVPVNEKISISKRIINKLLRIVNAEKRLLYISPKKMLNNIDLVLSIGGDIYTIPAVLRKNTKYYYYNTLIDFCEQSRKPIVVYGASVGPWGDYNRALNYYSRNMKKYRAILCREKSSVDYLINKGFKNVVFFPDPAFLLGRGQSNNGDAIGINISPLSFNEVYGECGARQIEEMAHLIDRIIIKFNRDVIFLPHVLSNDEKDNDYLFMCRIRERMSNKNNVIIAENNNGFLGIKNYIYKCHLVISARMHCAVNAIEENIPTIFLAYSQKGYGMGEYVYGNQDWIVNLESINDNLIERIERMDKDYDRVVNELVLRNIEIQNEYKSNMDVVKKIIKK